MPCDERHVGHHGTEDHGRGRGPAGAQGTTGWRLKRCACRGAPCARRTRTGRSAMCARSASCHDSRGRCCLCTSTEHFEEHATRDTRPAGQLASWCVPASGVGGSPPLPRGHAGARAAGKEQRGAEAGAAGVRGTGANNSTGRRDDDGRVGTGEVEESSDCLSVCRTVGRVVGRSVRAARAVGRELCRYKALRADRLGSQHASCV